MESFSSTAEDRTDARPIAPQWQKIQVTRQTETRAGEEGSIYAINRACLVEEGARWWVDFGFWSQPYAGLAGHLWTELFCAYKNSPVQNERAIQIATQKSPHDSNLSPLRSWKQTLRSSKVSSTVLGWELILVVLQDRGNLIAFYWKFFNFEWKNLLFRLQEAQKHLKTGFGKIFY